MKRSGTILIIVAGVAALLASLAFAFLIRMRADAEEMSMVMRESQARIMLMSACNYVQEASRLGYDNKPGWPAGHHREAFGWIDARDGHIAGAAVGPKDENFDLCYSNALVEDSNGDGAADRPSWPALYSVARCPMYVMKRPPYAVQLKVTYNPVVQDEASANFGMPYLSNPDPQPQASAYNDWVNGDQTPRSNSLNRSWFRVYRDSAATFVVTCGGGASLGFKDWSEVKGAGEEATFGSDQALFDDIVASECRLWYRIEWTAAIKDVTYHNIHNDLGTPVWDHYMLYPMNSSHSYVDRTEGHTRNMIGTIRWVQRLRFPPTKW